MKKYITAIAVLLLYLFPFVVTSPYIQRIAVLCTIFAVLASSLGLLVGQVRLVSAGHAAFFGIGAYTSALLTTKGEYPFVVGLVGAILLSALVGFLFSIPILRLRGHYLAMGTLAFGIVVQVILLNWESVTNGPNGIPGVPFPAFFSLVLDTDTKVYFFTLSVLLVLLLALRRLYQSPVGRAFHYIRDDEIAAASLGIHVVRYKVLAFTISAGIAGLAGCLFAHYMAFINYDTFSPMESFMILAMVVVGGMSTLLGPVLGATLLTAIPEMLRGLADYRMLFYGIILVVVLLFRPEGILGKSSRRVKPGAEKG